MKDIYVLLHRLELEDNANQTEDVEPYLFESEDDAVEFAVHLMRQTTDEWGWIRKEQDLEARALEDGLRSAPKGGSAHEPHADHLVHLTDSDNEVFELYRRGIARTGHLYPTV